MYKRRRIMKFKMSHENYNVSDLKRSIKFYNEALDLHEVRRLRGSAQKARRNGMYLFRK